MFKKAFRFRRKSAEEDQSSTTPLPKTISQEINALPPVSAPARLSVTTRVTESVRRKSSDADAGPLGLNTVYTPRNGHQADIVFIHGLGGTSKWSWSKDRDSELFWPLTFLPLEPDLCLARILTFGYNANILRSGSISTSVLDFAKDLLFDLKYAKNQEKEDLHLGEVPLIFVVHSMGGLIVKEAYIQGQNDPEYKSIIKAISAITFLATPHRGTNLAATLNRILQTTVISNAKQYISDLARNSFQLQKLNEQFRHIAPNLHIVSFYETQPTSIGLKNARVMVLEKDSSVLGYPGETSKALDADHHGVCKYENPNDPNYIVVRNVLQSLISRVLSSSRDGVNGSRSKSESLASLLAITELPDTDYIFYRDQWTPGTGQWVLANRAYCDWQVGKPSSSCLLWLTSGPATGKSVLASFIINTLVEQGFFCQYFFIRFGDRKKRTLSLLLRSIAYQVARQLPSFRQKLKDIADEAIEFENADPKVIWERLFKSVLFRTHDLKPLYWVIDGVDEADDARGLIRLVPDIASSLVPIRIILVGRETPEIASALRRLPATVNLRSVTIEGQVEDLRCYIEQELDVLGTIEFKKSIKQRLINEAHNNFLWVRLAILKLNSCRTFADVERSLEELPPGMNQIYDRMALTVNIASSTGQSLASSILHCILSSFRTLSVAELSHAITDDVSDVLDFQQSVVDLCGGFVVVDNDGNVSLVHQTAREYLSSNDKHALHIDREAAHDQMFISCMRCLTATGLRGKLSRNSNPEFLAYAMTWWSSHLQRASASQAEIFDVLVKFFTGHWVLTWIHALAASNQLRVLVQASEHLSKYVTKRRSLDISIDDQGSNIIQLQILNSWAVDCVKVVGKFGSSLRRNPESIYKLVAPFCPPASAMYQQFGKSEARMLHVTGQSSEDWDDSLARLPLGSGAYASRISAAGSQIAILAASGIVFLFSSATFQESVVSPVRHGERVYKMALSSTGMLLVTYGFKTTKAWDLRSGRCTLTVTNLVSRPRPLTLLLTNDNTSLIVGTDDRQIRSLNLVARSPAWESVVELEEPELEGHFLNSSSYMAMNKDGSLIAVAYRGHPLSAWEVDGPTHIAHCWRDRKELARGEVIDAVWHPYNQEVLGLYIEGVVFRWSPYEGQVNELATGASQLAISNDGSLFATGDVHGIAKVFSYPDFGLVYQLASQDSILGLTFSPDRRRFYDIRGYYGNAWEPNALMRLADRTRQEDLDSETGSVAQSSLVPTEFTKKIQSITALAASPRGRFFSYGTEYGSVKLLDNQHEHGMDLHTSKSFLSIECITWSEDAKYLAFSDSAKKIYILSVAAKTTAPELTTEVKGQISVKAHAKGPILHLLFSPNSTSLLIASPRAICILSVEPCSILRSMELSEEGVRWIAHPQDSTILLGIGVDSVRLLKWDLTELYECRIISAQPLDHPETHEASSSKLGVERVLVTQDKKHILLQIAGHAYSSKEARFLCCLTSAFPTSVTPATDIAERVTATSLSIPASTQMMQILSFLSQDRLIYVSENFSICSWRLSLDASPSPAPTPPTLPVDKNSFSSSRERISLLRSHSSGTINRVKELFPLPGDWVSRDSLALCCVWNAERTLLVPRNGEVALVRSAGLA